MVAEVFSAMIQGIEGQIVKIQVDISNGLPNFNITINGLLLAVREAPPRIREEDFCEFCSGRFSKMWDFF